MFSQDFNTHIHTMTESKPGKTYGNSGPVESMTMMKKNNKKDKDEEEEFSMLRYKTISHCAY